MELQCRGSVKRHQENKNITNHGSGLPDKKPSILRGEANMDVAIPLNQATNTSEENNYRIRHDEHQPYNALPPNFSDEAPSRIEQDSIDVGVCKFLILMELMHQFQICLEYITYVF